MRKFHSESMANTEMNFLLPKGSWGGIRLVYRGTNPVVAKTRLDLGTIQLNIQNKPIIDCQVDLMSYLTNLKGGVETFTSVGGGALYADVFIPFGKYKDTNNVYLVSETQRALLRLQFPLLSDVVAGIIDVYLIAKDGIQNYWYAITSRYVVAGGAGNIADVAVIPNISEVYLVTPTVISEVRLQKDGQALIDGDVPALQAQSDWNNQIETTNTLLEIPLNPSKDLSETVSNELAYNYTFTGAGTLRQFFGYIIFTPADAVKSKTVLQQQIQNRAIVTKQAVPKVLPAGLGTVNTGGQEGKSVNTTISTY